MKYWTDAEREYMRQHYPNADSQQIATHIGRSVFSVYQHAAIAGLKKSAEFHQAMYALRGEKLKIKGAASRFKAGQRPWNLAKKMQLHPNSHTQLSNLELLDRAQLMARNTIHRYPGRTQKCDSHAQKTNSKNKGTGQWLRTGLTI